MRCPRHFLSFNKKVSCLGSRKTAGKSLIVSRTLIVYNLSIEGITHRKSKHDKGQIVCLRRHVLGFKNAIKFVSLTMSVFFHYIHVLL